MRYKVTIMKTFEIEADSIDEAYADAFGCIPENESEEIYEVVEIDDE